MSTITVRNLPDDVVARLKARAAQQGRSMEAEARRVLADSVSPSGIEAAAVDALVSHRLRVRARPASEVRARLGAIGPAPGGWAEELHRDRDDDQPEDPWRRRDPA
ncbi:FitA-like ribbon-helix-helix domain-containing protein [Microbacterium karelineae]|uniref:FitA-like ribbon-helix-helix domain-containing protein n=1 Tax=Microbacterium karelineae TaxID=2654283 RepID=UPI0018D394BC|nr:hypothetical protein [Microbacterium karelineae]